MIDSEVDIVRAAIAAVRGGDREAFARVIDVYQRRLFGLALMMSRDPSGAEEVAQDDRRLWHRLRAAVRRAHRGDPLLPPGHERA